MAGPSSRERPEWVPQAGKGVERLAPVRVLSANAERARVLINSRRLGGLATSCSSRSPARKRGPVNSPSAIGLVFYHVYLVYDAKNNFYLASNPVPLTLVK